MCHVSYVFFSKAIIYVSIPRYPFSFVFSESLQLLVPFYCCWYSSERHWPVLSVPS